MSPEVVTRKISNMLKYLDDLSPYKSCSYEAFYADHYKVERLIELLVISASDIAFHMISKKGESPPTSYRAAFLRLGELELIDPAVAGNLALGAGLRNILVYEYEEIDYHLLHESIPAVIRDMQLFMDAVAKGIAHGAGSGAGAKKLIAHRSADSDWH